MKRLLILALCLSAYLSAGEISKGKLLFKKDFDIISDVSKSSVKFNKETQHKLADGKLHAIPPVIAYAGTGKQSKWANSSFSRVNFPNLPKDYICEFKLMINEPTDAKSAKKSRAYFDMGHRCIRLTLSSESSLLVLENHLTKGEAKPISENTALKLEYNKWYTVQAWVKADKAQFLINGTKFSVTDPLIKGERANTFNIDISGAGYQLDNFTVWEIK
jgi:hypothetical protein